MSDERLGQLAGAWLREHVPPPRDPQGSVARTMARAAETPQRRRTWLPAILAGEPKELVRIQRSRAATGTETRPAPREVPPRRGQAGLALATMASFVVAVLLVGAFILPGRLARTAPTGAPAASAPAVVATSEPSTSPLPGRAPTAVQRQDGIRVRLTLDEAPLTSGAPSWITTRVVNASDEAIEYVRDGCEINVYVDAHLRDQAWRPGSAATREHRWQGSNWVDARAEAISLDFRTEPLIGRPTVVCDSLGLLKTLEPGEAVDQRLHWDGQAAGTLGPLPQGIADISGSFEFRRAGARAEETIEVSLEVPVQGHPSQALLHPMEAVDAALADPRFAALLAESDADGRGIEYVLYDTQRAAWVVGACGPHAGKRSYWRAALVDPVNGDVTDIIEGASGQSCAAGLSPGM